MSRYVLIRNGMEYHPTTGLGGAREDGLMAIANDILNGGGIVDKVGGDLLVTEQASPVMSVHIAKGRLYIANSGWVKNTYDKNKLYPCLIDADEDLDIEPNSSGTTRHDLICVKIDLTIDCGDSGENAVTLVVVKGADDDTVPSTPANHYKLAEVEVANGASTIVNADITDSRVQSTINSDYIVSGSGGTSYSNIFRQALINPSCEINQPVTAVNLTSGKLFGNVDMFYAKGAGTAVSAGTINQSTTANCGNSGFALKLAGVTLTGTGKVHAYTFIESLNAKLYKNKTASFSVKVYHDVGSAIDYIIKINKADVADNFSAVTNIATASVQSVPNTTETLIKLENVDLGDCSNGIEIEIEGDCGAITTKNFEFTDWIFNEGSVVLDFCCESFEVELGKCQRYYEKSYDYGTAPGTATADGGLDYYFPSAFTGPIFIPAYYKVTKRITPTPTLYDIAGASGKVYKGGNGKAGNCNQIGQANFSPGTADATSAVELIAQWTANARPTIA
jgi:hypothetical protein